ncbi:Esterase TesA precursor [Thiorhodovibrio litoralis]|nr:Esterase TesA precursor [Thiorhodovibrio litoralis]
MKIHSNCRMSVNGKKLLSTAAETGAVRGLGLSNTPTWAFGVLLFVFLMAVSVARPCPAAEPLNLLILGDSLSAAYGLHVDDGWVALLGQRLREQQDRALGAAPAVVITNASISGETTAGGLERLPDLLAEHQPNAVMIALGANDGLRGFPLQDIEDRLVRLVETARAADAEVLLLGVRLPPNYGAAYSEGFQRLFAAVAERTGVALVPRMLEGVSERWDLMQSDGLHPTAAAQPLILDHLWPSVQALLGAASGESAIGLPRHFKSTALADPQAGSSRYEGISHAPWN